MLVSYLSIFISMKFSLLFLVFYFINVIKLSRISMYVVVQFKPWFAAIYDIKIMNLKQRKI